MIRKRTYEQSLSFFKRNTDNRGFGRELYKTPDYIIRLIVEDILNRKPYLFNKLWIDPCAGDGRWEKIIREYDVNVKSFDIEPLDKIVEQQDFYEYNTEEDIFIIGNPPFKQLKKFINKSLSLCNECYFLGGSQIITGTLSNKVSLLHRFEGFEGNQKDKRSKIKFIDTFDKDVLVWSCGAIFDNIEHNNFTHTDVFSINSFRTSVKKYCIEDERVVSLKKGDIKNEINNKI